MELKYDFYERVKEPVLYLCNPNDTRICKILRHEDFTLELNYASYSELSVRIYKKFADGKEFSQYELITPFREIEVLGLGYFIIDSAAETDDGKDPYFEVTAKSCDSGINKRFSLAAGTYQFYDEIEPTKTILGKIMMVLPTWKIGQIPNSVKERYRTFEDLETDLYSYMMDELSEIFGCLFQFDIQNKVINIIDSDNELESTGIYLTFKNIVNNIQADYDTKDVTTALAVYGSNEITIRDVNPIGGEYIYNFAPFMSEDWMSSELVEKIRLWEQKISNNESIFADLVLQAQNAQRVLLSCISELAEEKAKLEELEKIRLEYAVNAEEYEDITEQIAAQTEIVKQKQIEVDTKTDEASSLMQNIAELQLSLSIEQNFTTEQYKELSCYIHEGRYQEENIVITDSMSYEEKQEQIKALYEKGKLMASKLSVPKMSFTVDCESSFFLKEFNVFRKRLDLGKMIHVKKESAIYNLILTGYKIDFDNQKFSLNIGNQFKFHDKLSDYQKLYKLAVSASSAVSTNKHIWDFPQKSGAIDKFSDYMQSSLDLTKQSIISSENEEQVFDRIGILLRRLIPKTKNYDPCQMRLTSNGIALTNDAFKTIKTAIGKLMLPNGTSVYGINADLILVGKILANLIQIGGGGDNPQLVVYDNGDNPLIKLDKEGITLSNGAKLIGGNGVISKNVFSTGPLQNLGVDVDLDYGEIYARTISLDYYIPDNFVITEAKLYFLASPIYYSQLPIFNSMGESSTWSGWGVAKGIKVYQALNVKRSVPYTYRNRGAMMDATSSIISSSNFKDITYTAFSQTSLNPTINQSWSPYSTTTDFGTQFVSLDIKNSLSTGQGQLVIIPTTIPSFNLDSFQKDVSIYSGWATANLVISGYTK